jgi:hypothetical protein
MSSGKSIFEQLRALFGTSKDQQKSVDGPIGPERPVSPRKGVEISDSAPEVDLVLGIDFGTSCSKVVIGDHGWQGQSFAVPVGGQGAGLDRFLRVTQVLVGGSVEANLKMRLMVDPASQLVRELVALYLAGIIRDSLRWFRAEGPKRYLDRRPAWSLNLGFPAKSVKEGVLVEAYREIADWAVRLALTDLPLDLASLRSQCAGSATEPSKSIIPPGRIHLYPEIGAQLAGYVNSPYRVRENLILIDVGAGTLDVSTIILHGNNEEDVVSFHFCEVGPFGAMKLLEVHMAALEAVESGSVRIRLEDFQSGNKPTPESPGVILGMKGQIGTPFTRAFEDASKQFAHNAIWLAVGCARDFRLDQRRAHANTSFDPWPNRLRFFFTGGGSRARFFRQHFVDGPFEQTLTSFTRWEREAADRRRSQQGLRLEPLPAPADLLGFPKELVNDFDRLSVAHGLAYGGENLMKITASVHS